MLGGTASTLEADLPTIFLILLAEGLPFLLLGSLFSGLMEAFVGPQDLQLVVPRRALPVALMGLALGLALPVGDVGAVVVARRLWRKGAPLPLGVVLLLAAPAVNPLVLAALGVTFGWGRMLLLRVAVGLIVALVMGLLFACADATDDLLRSTALVSDTNRVEEPFGKPLRSALHVAVRDFLDLGRYLAIGAFLAALVQMFIPQGVLLAADAAPLPMFISAQALAYLLSAGPLGDARLALNLPYGAALAYLAFGAVADLKGTLMWLSVFKVRAVIYLIALPLLIVLLAGLIIRFCLMG